jgi:hypothetical protein
MGRAFITYGKKIYLYRILPGRPDGNRPLLRPRRRREQDIKMNPRNTGWSSMDWIDLAQDREQQMVLVNTDCIQCSG